LTGGSVGTGQISEEESGDSEMSGLSDKELSDCEEEKKTN
jgi:hypothetical protein